MADAWRHTPFIMTPHRRRWGDISKGRLILGLVAAPILPILLGSSLVWLLYSSDPFADDGAFISPSERFTNVARIGAILEAAAGSWSLVAGLAALRLRSWRSGLIGRIDCFLLGILLAFSFPLVFWLDSFVVDAILVRWGSPVPYFHFGELSMDGLGIAALVGLPLTPFGLLGGWIFWRLVVRPAVAHVLDVTGVFE